MYTYNQAQVVEIGVDEAGRGPLLGRLYAGACIWAEDLHTNIIKDSKKYKNENERIKAYDFIIDNAISYGSAYIEPWDIDRMGMTRSVMSAMHNAIENTYIYPDHIIVDGNYFKELPLSDIDRGSYSYTTVIGGDNLYYSIAAASVIAKVEHDKYIHELCILHPILKEYDIDNNKGYGTAKHLEVINTKGITKYHRKSFKCCTNVTKYLEL